MKYIRTLIHPESVREYIETHYQYGSSFTCSLLYTGVNDHYLIENKKAKYVLRVNLPTIYYIKDKSNFIYEAEWLHFLKDRVSTIYPIQMGSGEWVGELPAIEGNRFCTLFSFAEGEYVNRPQISHVKIFAENLAKLHKYSKDFTSSVKSPNRGYGYFLERNISILEDYQNSHWNKLLEHILKKITIYKQKFDEIGFISEKDHIWGDSHYGNCLYKKEVVTFMDLDFCGSGYKIFDIASYLWGFKLNKLKNYNAIHKEFLNRYESIYPLTKNEREAIPLMILIRNIDTLVFQLQYNLIYLGSYARNNQFWYKWLEGIIVLESTLNKK